MYNLILKKQLLNNYLKLLDMTPKNDPKRLKLIQYSFALRSLIGREGGFNNSVEVYNGIWAKQLGFERK